MTQPTPYPYRLEPAIVTSAQWLLAPDGNRYLYFYSRKWKVVTDKCMPINGFRSTEKWSLVAYDRQDNVLAIIPGCQVKGILYADERPPELLNEPSGRAYEFELGDEEE